MSKFASLLGRAAMVSGLIGVSVYAADLPTVAPAVSTHYGDTFGSAARSEQQASAKVTQQVAPGETPQGISAQAWASIQRQIAQAQYEAAPLPSQPDAISAHNPKQRLRLSFDRNGAGITSLQTKTAIKTERAALQLRTMSIGRGIHSVDAETVQPIAQGSRIEYHRTGWTEWYVNTAQGLEHGYTLARPLLYAPASTESPATNRVRITIAVSGMRLNTQPGGDLRLTDNRGRVLSYGKLVVNDANGRRLPAQLTATAAERFEIAFDDSAARYPVTVDPLLVNDEQTISAPGDNPDYEPQDFGASVAITSGTLLVGAPLALGYGAVYVYTSSGSKWILQQRLTAQDAQEEDQFGTAVSLSGDTALIGAPSFDSSTKKQGAAYVFERSGTGWTQQAEFMLDDAGAGGNIGGSVALSGDTALVSAGGDDFSFALIYVRSGTTWTKQAKLQGADQKSTSGPVAISGDTALVAGAPGGGSGCAYKIYVFVRSGTQWIEQQPLATTSCIRSGGLALSADTAVVGVGSTTVGANSSQGAAYVYLRSGANWVQQAQLIAADGSAQDRFGTAVSLTGDIVVVGAPYADIGSSVDQGAAYVFQRSGTSWAQQAKLVAADGAENDQFGSAVAFDGTYAIAGAPLDDKKAADIGSAYVFKVSSGIWSQKTALSANSGAYLDRFGNSVALSGDTALVGVNEDAVGGSAYVFVRSETGWVKQAKLTSDATDAAMFGSAVALSDETALVGAPFYSEPDKDHATGAAFVFVRSGTIWSLQAKLKAADAAVSDKFGGSVALSDDTAVVGAAYDDGKANKSFYPDQGSAYAFVRSGEIWTQQAKFVGASMAGTYFGSSVAISGDTALFVAPQQQDADGRYGVVYLSQRSGTQWSALTRLMLTDPSHPACKSVALLDDTALLGCDPVSAVFVRNGTAWNEQATLTVTTGLAAFSGFGSAVALGGDTALIGASNDTGESGGANQGAAYLFTRVGSTWTQQSKLSDAAGSTDDQFGFAVALSGTEMLIGAPTDNTPEGVHAGSVHFFRIGIDYGDAPAPYPTLLADKGARHFIDTDGPLLGGSIDDEADGQPNSGATGDDIAGSDDETAVTFGKLTPGAPVTITVKVNGKFDSAQLDAWIDFNADGDWDDSGEQVCMQCAVVKGTNSLQAAVPSSATIGQTYARFRLSQTGTGKVKTTGRLVTGEVEDYIVKIKSP